MKKFLFVLCAAFFLSGCAVVNALKSPTAVVAVELYSLSHPLFVKKAAPASSVKKPDTTTFYFFKNTAPTKKP